MPWKNEIDRMVSRAILDAAKAGENEVQRALRTIDDLLELAPERAQSHFHVGTAERVLPEDAVENLPASEGEAGRWRHLGRLEAAARRGQRDAVSELMDDPMFEESLAHPEGRIALRAVGRILLRGGEDEKVFDYYKRHLKAVDDEGSRRDAEFLLEEALRRADRYDRNDADEEGALGRLQRAGAFVEDAGLEARAGAKVDRKMGRMHQLAERWDDAVVCYQRALERLPADDPYRSVLVGDLALATLGVRGTLDLLPVADRESRAEAQAILTGADDAGDGRSYNAIYTLGMLYYEQGDHEHAAACFREADDLMRANRAKARIVHARSRFFLGHCLLELGAEGEDLELAERNIRRDAGPSNLDAEIKDPVFAALQEAVPDARIPGRRRERQPRGRRPAKAPAARQSSATDHLEAARETLAEDPHHALELVDRAFKSRPDFDTWYGAYVTRLEALVALNEREEALRTYERFRAKLYQRETLDRIESLLLDADGPLASLIDDTARSQELVDLFEVMPDREQQFVDACLTCARAYLESEEPDQIRRAVALLREAAARDAEAASALLKDAEKSAEKAGVSFAEPSEEACAAKLAALEEPLHLLLVGGDEGRRPHLQSFQDLSQRLGFEGEWIFTGARPPHKTLQEIEDSARDTDAILVHHGAGPDVRAEVRRLAGELEIPLRESAWMGRHGVASEVMQVLDAACADSE